MSKLTEVIRQLNGSSTEEKKFKGFVADFLEHQWKGEKVDSANINFSMHVVKDEEEKSNKVSLSANYGMILSDKFSTLLSGEELVQILTKEGAVCTRMRKIPVIRGKIFHISF